MSKEREYRDPKTVCLYYTGQRWFNGVKQPKEIEEVYSMIERHPYFSDPSKISSLTRWILHRVCRQKLSTAYDANDAWARSLFEFMYWSGENYGFDEGEGKEQMFERMFVDGDLK